MPRVQRNATIESLFEGLDRSLACPPAEVNFDRETARLVWRPEGDGEHKHVRPDQLLPEFLTLSARRPDRIVTFVSQWGPLGVCRQHARPANAVGCSLVQDDNAGEQAFAESMETWETLATETRQALEALARLGHGDELLRRHRGLEGLPTEIAQMDSASQAIAFGDFLWRRWRHCLSTETVFVPDEHLRLDLSLRVHPWRAHPGGEEANVLSAGIILTIEVLRAAWTGVAPCARCGQLVIPATADRRADVARTKYCSQTCRSAARKAYDRVKTRNRRKQQKAARRQKEHNNQPR